MHIFTKAEMVGLTAAGEGEAEASDRRLDITIAGRWDGIASVIVASAPYREYLHLLRTPDGWKIANALYMPL